MDDEPFRFASTIVTEHQAMVLEPAPLARIAQECLLTIAESYPAQVWGYVILPDAVHIVLEVELERHYHEWVEAYKALSERRLIEAIRQQYPALVDQIMRLNPAWGGAIYRVWQEGYHTQALHSIYAVSNRIADLLNKPLELGLVTRIEDYPFSSFVAEE